jgi:hypothetical protein
MKVLSGGCLNNISSTPTSASRPHRPASPSRLHCQTTNQAKIQQTNSLDTAPKSARSE